ncbi:ABC transporter permease subunit [bacterium]|nr:ABC transporter permease subunit [bacterium]
MSPLLRRRIARFCQIRRGFYSLIILSLAIFVSLFSNYIANNRAIIVKYNGEYYFPTYKFMAMEVFGQEDEWGFTDAETDYVRLKKEWEGTENWVMMPLIPFNPSQNDFDFYKDKDEQPIPPPHPPDDRHLLGTDSQGRDVAARLLYGFRLSIFFALMLTLCGYVIGVVIGSLQGFLAGWFDLTTQRFIEIWSLLPVLYVVILLRTVVEPTFWTLLAVMLIFEWMGITYYMRTEVYREKTREYALAARAAGASTFRIVFKHLLPNCLTPLITFGPFAIIAGISALTSLDYLGYGLPPPTPSWGELIEQSMDSSNRGKLWLVLSPFVALTFTLILVTMIGESIREAFDPRRQSRYD